ncbi:hypothetical protein SVAN01_01536 [Stagonosporopsis vannaccii]|nr:hypothetical protein SVAN01_01536 [Stagonosporopsis vannaccii]
MPSPPLLWLVFLLFVSSFHLTIASTVAHTLDITFADGSVLVADAVFYKTYELVAWALHGFFAFLEYMRMPPWLFYFLFAACLSPHLCLAVVSVFTVVADAGKRVVEEYYSYHRNATIARLRQRLTEYYTPDTVYNLRLTHDKQVVTLEQRITTLRSEISRSNEELQISQGAKVALQNKVDQLQHELELITELYHVEAVRDKEKRHNRDLRKAENDITDLKTTLAEVEGKYLRAQRRIGEEQWDFETCKKLVHEYDAKLDEKQQKIYRQNAEIKQLSHNLERDAKIHRLQRQDVLLKAIMTVIFALAQSGDKIEQITVTLFVSALKQAGIDLTELGIDPHQHETFLTWAKDLYENGSSVLSPTMGFRLQGFRGDLSGVYVSGGKTYGATSPDFGLLSLSSQVFWNPPGVNGTPQMPLAVNNVVAKNAFGGILQHESGTVAAPAAPLSLSLGQPSAATNSDPSLFLPQGVAITSGLNAKSEMVTHLAAGVTPTPTGSAMDTSTDVLTGPVCFAADTASTPFSEDFFNPSILSDALDNALDSPSGPYAWPPLPTSVPGNAPGPTNDANDLVDSDCVIEKSPLKSKKKTTAEMAKIIRWGRRAVVSSFCLSPASGPIATDDFETGPSSSFGKDLGMLFGPNARLHHEYGWFNTLTWRYITPPPRSSSAARINRGQMFIDLHGMDIMTDPDDVKEQLSRRREFYEGTFRAMGSFADIDVLDLTTFSSNVTFAGTFADAAASTISNMLNACSAAVRTVSVTSTVISQSPLVLIDLAGAYMTGYFPLQAVTACKTVVVAPFRAITQVLKDERGSDDRVTLLQKKPVDIEAGVELPDGFFRMWTSMNDLGPKPGTCRIMPECSQRKIKLCMTRTKISRVT